MSDSGMNDEMITRLQAGDEAAIVEAFSVHRERLKRMLEFRMDPRLRGREDASDILQEVYLDARQRIRHYLKRSDQSFYIWRRHLTQQRLIDVHRRHLKAEMRDVKQEVSLHTRSPSAASASMAWHFVADLASPSQVAMRAELAAQIEAALESMDQIDREIIAMRHFEELRNCEVAELLGIKEAAASNRYMRALARLREVLQNVPGFLDED